MRPETSTTSQIQADQGFGRAILEKKTERKVNNKLKLEKCKLELTQESLRVHLAKRINVIGQVKFDGNQGKLWNDKTNDESLRILGMIIKTACGTQKLEIDCSG